MPVQHNKLHSVNSAVGHVYLTQYAVRVRDGIQGEDIGTAFTNR